MLLELINYIWIDDSLKQNKNNITNSLDFKVTIVCTFLVSKSIMLYNLIVGHLVIFPTTFDFRALEFTSRTVVGYLIV